MRLGWISFLGTAAAFAGCIEPAQPQPGLTPPPAGVRTPLPPQTSDAPACGEAASDTTLASTTSPTPRVNVVLGQPGEPAPVDEIPFNHKVHAGDCRIPCLGCHVYAAESPSAGLPSGKKCMGCHKFVAKEKPAVQVLSARFRAGQPLRWTRVFSVPDFVYFTHRAHLSLDEPIDCKECHGDVAAMKVVRQQEPFTMGRCITCHEKKNAPHDCQVCHK